MKSHKNKINFCINEVLNEKILGLGHCGKQKRS